MGPELERNEGRMKGMELQANPHLNTNLALSAPSQWLLANSGG